MKAEEYFEAIMNENEEQKLHALFYEQMFDEDVSPMDSVFLSDLVHFKLSGEFLKGRN